MQHVGVAIFFIAVFLFLAFLQFFFCGAFEGKTAHGWWTCGRSRPCQPRDTNPGHGLQLQLASYFRGCKHAPTERHICSQRGNIVEKCTRVTTMDSPTSCVTSQTVPYAVSLRPAPGGQPEAGAVRHGLPRPATTAPLPLRAHAGATRALWEGNLSGGQTASLKPQRESAVCTSCSKLKLSDLMFWRLSRIS